jgi:hypothetical protein
MTILVAAGASANDKSRTETASEPNCAQISHRYREYGRIGRLALAFIWLFFAPTTDKILQCQKTPVAQRVTVPFTTADGNVGVPLLLVQATINGKQATLILDSGAQHLVITPELANGLRPLGKVEHGGIGGKTKSSVVAVQIRLGGVTFPYCLAETDDLRAVNSSLGVKIDGLIGESVLSRFKTITIDYTNHMVYLD